MAYKIPEFNLLCDIYEIGPTSNTFRLQSVCALIMGPLRRFPTTGAAGAPGAGGYTPILALPALTDIRDGSCQLVSNLVDVPAGSGRWYISLMVDDVAKGWPNEYRIATLAKTWKFPGSQNNLPGFWPNPIP